MIHVWYFAAVINYYEYINNVNQIARQAQYKKNKNKQF